MAVIDFSLLQKQSQAFKGFLLAASGLLLFACMDATTKYFTAHFSVPFVMAMRYLSQLSLMIILLAPRHAQKMVFTNRTGLVFLRAASLTLGSLFVGLALQRMPLAETTAINFLSPILVVLLASPLLEERIGVSGWVAALGGFTGVMIIVRPGSGLDYMGVVFALLGVGVGAAYQILSRVLAPTEKAVAMLFYTALLGAIFYGIGLIWFWEHRTPSTTEWLLLLSMGVTGGLGHYLFTLAFQYAPASIIAPTTYLQLLWAALLGWLVFHYVPDGISLLGMTIVAASGVLIAVHSRRHKG